VAETMIAFASLQVLLCLFFLHVRRLLLKVSKYHHTVRMLGRGLHSSTSQLNLSRF